MSGPVDDEPRPQQPPLWMHPEPARAAAGHSDPRSRRRPARFVIIALVVVLVAGLGTWLLWPEQNREPFDQAVDNLAAAAAVHYRTSKYAGQSTSDVTVTAHGDAVGTGTDVGRQFRTLQVGDELYVRSDGGVPVATGLPESLLRDKWVTGSSDLTGTGTKQAPSPRELAEALRSVLAKTAEFPSESDPVRTVAGIRALKATTPTGDLYVTEKAPHRVLRYVPDSAMGSSSAPRPPSFPPVGSGPSDADDAPSAAGSGDSDPDRLLRGLGTTDFAPMSPVDVDEAYEALETGMDQLGDAVDTDVDLQLTGNLQLACSAGGCTVTANVTNASPGGASGGRLTAILTATVAVEGQPAGGCSNRAVLPISGGTISCAAPSAGPVWAAAEARKGAAAQAEANAQAAAQPGRLVRVPYQVRGTTQGTVYATPQLDLGQEKDRLRKQRSEAGCPTTPNSFAAGTPVLLADGSSRPIEAVTTGTRVRSTDPLTGRTAAEPVLATVTGHGQKHLEKIIVADGPGTGSVTATANHPFWSPDRRAWVHADSLRPGLRLATADGGIARIAGVQPSVRALPVYNLSIADLHTYYVLAGETPILVHNGGPCVNWAANSVKTFGHTFRTHGAGAKNTKALTDRARGTGNPQGQWLDNDAAAEFLKSVHIQGAGPRSVPLPRGLGQVIMPDGRIVQARAATLVPGPNGMYRTAFPIIGPN